MAAAQLNASLREGLGAAKPCLVPESSPGQARPFQGPGRARAGRVRRSGGHAPGMSLLPNRPRRPACADSVRSSRSLRDPFTALGPIEVLLRWEPVLGRLG